MPTKKCGRIRKTYSKTTIKKTEVLRILRVIMEKKSAQASSSTTAPMQTIDAAGNVAESTTGTDVNADNFNNFFNTGRIGRRNALPDILDACAKTSTADLPEKFNALTTTDVVMSSSNQTSDNSDNGAIASSSPSSSSSSSMSQLPTSNNTCSSSSSNYNDSNINPT